MNTDWLIPAIRALVVAFGLIRRAPVYDSFVRGAGKGLKTAFSVLPCLTAIMVAVEMLKASGALGLLCQLLAAPLGFLGVPAEAAPLVVVRPFSGMAALGMLEDVLRGSGPDSLAGRVASAIMGSTETLFYTVAIYFGAVGIQGTRHTIPAALVSLIVSIVASGILVRLLLQ